jgi:hypothetical protein
MFFWYTHRKAMYTCYMETLFLCLNFVRLNRLAYNSLISLDSCDSQVAETDTCYK